MMAFPKIQTPGRRGFFFTVLALILVSFMMISVQLWAASQAAEEQRAATRFGLEALRTSLALVDDRSLSHYANSSMIYAVKTLSENIENDTDPSVRGLPCDTGRSACSSLAQLGSGPFPDGTAAINRSIHDLMTGGSTSGAGPASNGIFSPNLSYSEDEKKYQLDRYFNTTSAAAALLGYNLTWGTPTNFTFTQSDAWTLTVYFDVPANLSDSQNRLHVYKVIHANASLDINGLTDPYVLRQDIAYRPSLDISLRPHRNVYRVPDYNTSDDAQAKLMAKPVSDATEGIGWFYGPVSDKENTSFSDTNAQFNLSRISQYIFITNDVAKAVEQSRYFGAIILTGAYAEDDPGGWTSNSTAAGACTFTTYAQKQCLNCLMYTTSNDSANCPVSTTMDVNLSTVPARADIPYNALKGSLPDVAVNFALQLPEVLINNRVNNSDVFGSPARYTNLPSSNARRKFAESPSIPANQRAESSVYDLNGPRDLAICGFYVRSYWGPSYLQRWTALPAYQSGIPYSHTNQGIESYVLGKWAAGADAPSDSLGDQRDSRSRIDYQFYQGTAANPGTPACIGPYDKGMPGCKNSYTCSDLGPQKNATGRFALNNLTVDPAYAGWMGDPAQRYNFTNISIDTALGTITACQ